jgi:guanylate kinase
MKMTFNRPTLVTLTAPTCSGKTTLLNLLTNPEAPVFTRIVSTTTRGPRAAERDGVDYHYISMKESVLMEERGEFAELVNFRGTRYGVTKREMQNKMNNRMAPMVILEPTGLAMYEQLCRENNWDIFRVYIYTTESKLLQRLSHRTAGDVMNILEMLTDPIKPATKVFIEKILDTHNDRVLSITGDERGWAHQVDWDLKIPGDEMEKSIADLEMGIHLRNRMNARLNT